MTMHIATEGIVDVKRVFVSLFSILKREFSSKTVKSELQSSDVLKHIMTFCRNAMCI